MRIKGSTRDEDITLINIYVCNTGTPKYKKQMLTDIQGEIYNSTITVGDFNIPLTSLDGHPNRKSRRQQWS